MPLATGRTLTHYEILGPLGAGGMGEVYRARDTRLEREVAIKVLPEELADDDERLRRFEREAKTLASLNHPNVAGIHGVDQEDDVCFLALELVPGEDLAARLSRGPLPVDEAIDVCRQIAEGLEAAHEAGVVHRDLKPANVRITPEGVVKILDFGLAKPIRPKTSGESGDTTAESDSFLMTEKGLVLGTPTYMSPEQARGKPVDRRTDIWAFGCVLYECLTGKRLFAGDAFGDLIVAILEREADLDALPAGTPPRVHGLIARCLVKDPRRRLRDIGEARLMLESPEATGSSLSFEGSSAVVTRPSRAPTPARRFAATLAAAAAGLLVGVASTWLIAPRSEDTPPPLDGRFEIVLRAGSNVASTYNRLVAISPDSRTLAYMTDEGLLVRSLDRTEPRPIQGTDEARSPAFSPDSRQLVYWDNGHITRVSIDGEARVVVAALQHRPMGFHWADDDYVYVGRADLGIWRVPSSGGELEQVVELNESEQAHGPELLPAGAGGAPRGDGAAGEWIMFSLARGVRAWSEGSIVAQSMATNERRVLLPRGREARYLANGYLSFVQDNTLFAAPFDLEKLAITGGAEAMETDVYTSKDDETGAASYDVSENGVLAFVPLGGAVARLAFLDRNYDRDPFPLGPRRLGAVRLSPDDSRVAAQINDLDGTHIWIVSAEREGAQRLTTTGRNTSPVWSHDGRYVYFASVRNGTSDIWRRPTDLSTPAEKVLESDGAELPNSVSADGKWLYYSRMSPGNSDLARVSLVGEPEVEILVESPADELDCNVSADGKFVSFQSTETGRWDIHVMEIETGRRWMVSSVAGYFPIWTRDGKRIFYSSSEGEYAVDVSTDPDFSADEPVLVFEGELAHQTLDATRDGERLLINYAETDDAKTESRPRVTAVLNWFGEIERRTAGGAPR